MLKNIEPYFVFKFFSDISSIPRESGCEQQICKYLIDFARARNLEFYTDNNFNVVIKKSAQNFALAPTTIIFQSHMDMVCVKKSTSNHNFKTDPLDLYSDGKFIMAKDTSLGADDGIGVAIMLALLDDKNISHPNLECVFTSDEEINLSGAQNLDKSILKGNLMINLDNETFGQICVSSAGGIMSDLHIEVNFIDMPQDFSLFELKIKGLKGGHSGTQINNELANANVLCGRFLNLLDDKTEVFLKDIAGGESDSYIANHAKIEFALPKNFINQLKNITEQFKNDITNEFAHSEHEIQIEIKNINGVSNIKVFDRTSTQKIIFALLTIPCRPISMHDKNLVETSNNLGKVQLLQNEIIFTSLSRSMLDSKKYYVADIIQAIANKIGGFIKYTGDFPGWNYNENSLLQNKIQNEFANLGYGIMNVEAIHAGLECGYFAKNNFDIISIGPNIFGYHTVNEKLEIESVQKLWTLIISLLQNLNVEEK